MRNFGDVEDDDADVEAGEQALVRVLSGVRRRLRLRPCGAPRELPFAGTGDAMAVRASEAVCARGAGCRAAEPCCCTPATPVPIS